MAEIAAQPAGPAPTPSDRSHQRRRAIVVGAGAAGISAAFWLRQRGFDVRVLEASTQIGGRCRSVLQDGYRFDIGAGALPDTYSNVLTLVRALGIEDEIERRGAVVGALRDGRVHRIDRRNPLTFLTARHIPAVEKLSLWRLGADLARMFRSINYYDLGTAARFDTQTVRDYCDQHYGPAVRDNLLAAITRALLLVEPEQTSVVDLFSACRSLLVAGHLLTHPEGIDFFLKRAAGHLDIALHSPVSQVADTGAGVDVSWHDRAGEHHDTVDACVLALSGKDTLAVYPRLDPTRRRYLEQLEYSSCIMVQLGVRRMPAERSSMVLIPRDIEPDLPVIGLGHNLGPARAPAGGGVLTAFWMTGWSEHHLDERDDALIQTTRRTINRLLPGWADHVETALVSRWSPAVVASRPGTYQGLVPFTQQTDPAARIQLAGDYLAQSSVNASVAAGERAAERLAATAIR